MTQIKSRNNVLEIAKAIYQPLSIKSIYSILKFVLVAKKHQSEIKGFNTRLEAIDVPTTSEMLGTIEWPYIHNEWDVAGKLNTIATHYELLTKKQPNLTKISTSPCLTICDFDSISNGVSIGIDYAHGFTREGELVINIFRDDLRVASMAFTIAKYQDNVVAYIGAVQGIHGGVPADESLQIYKVLTKDFAGLRPRSLLLEVLNVVAKQLGVTKVLGVSEQNRHHRHPYFGNDQKTEFKNNYNPFWEEHGGELIPESGFYEIPMAPAIRDIAEIASKKRGQYRKRNDFISSLPDAVNLG